MTSKNKKALLASLTALLATAGLGSYVIVAKSSLRCVPPGDVALAAVIDGDTIRVKRANGETAKVRLLGLDAPELDDCYGPEAKAGLAKLLKGAALRLDKDITGVDDYDRLLRYLVIESGDEITDNVLVNEYLLRQGLAFYYNSSPNNRYRELLQAAEAEAQKTKRGLWGACNYQQERDQANQAGREADAPALNADCIIKGNISEKGYGKTYLWPGCDNYESVKIDLRKGEAYFCSPAAAEAAGFRPATNCPARL